MLATCESQLSTPRLVCSSTLRVMVQIDYDHRRRAQIHSSSNITRAHWPDMAVVISSFLLKRDQLEVIRVVTGSRITILSEADRVASKVAV